MQTTMTRDEFIIEIENFYKEGVSLIKKKNADYCGDDDPFKNFMLAEHIGFASAENSIGVRMSDKLSRVATLLKQDAEVSEETIRDTLIDLANYAAILCAYVTNEKGKETGN